MDLKESNYLLRISIFVLRQYPFSRMVLKQIANLIRCIQLTTCLLCYCNLSQPWWSQEVYTILISRGLIIVFSCFSQFQLNFSFFHQIVIIFCFEKMMKTIPMNYLIYDFLKYCSKNMFELKLKMRITSCDQSLDSSLWICHDLCRYFTQFS